MTIDKRPSGSYRIRHTEDKKTYSITVPYKPSDKEAYKLIRAKIDGVKPNMAFKDAYNKYVAAKVNVLSPSTLEGYDRMYNNFPSWICDTDIARIDNYTLQRFVNEYAINHKPKTVKNAYSLILSVIRLFYPETTIRATLPKNPRIEPYTPSHNDVIKLLKHAEPTEFYVALYLASMSLRCSEIFALTLSDLTGNEILINKALVHGKKGYVLKETPKTDASYRTVTLPPDLVTRIRKQGYIYKGYPRNLDKYLRRTLPKLDIPVFSAHKLRHFFASYCHDLGYSDAQIKKLGGWDSDVFKNVYRHAMNETEARNQIAKDFIF